jgi:hypothetical protein
MKFYWFTGVKKGGSAYDRLMVRWANDWLMIDGLIIDGLMIYGLMIEYQRVIHVINNLVIMRLQSVYL